MPRFPAVAPLFLALITPSLLAQGGGGYVETAQSIGLVHEFLSGLDAFHDSVIHDTLQSGMAVGDVDGDLDLDVIACGGVGPNRLFINTGSGYADVSATAGIESGELDRAPALGDYDGDGDLDLFLGALEPGNGDSSPRSRLYLNDGTGVFRDVTTLAPTVGAGHSLLGQWADLDRDGLLDLIVSEFHGSLNRWYRNNGDGTMTEAAAALGLDHDGATHVTATADFDADGHPDVIVGNDFTAARWVSFETVSGDALLHGQADHTFLDVTEMSEADQTVGVMGLALADVDYDGDFDVYKTDIRDNWLLLNDGWPGTGNPWIRADEIYGIDNPFVPDPKSKLGFGISVGWAASFLHADFDPYQDLFLVNGKVAGLSVTESYSPWNQPNYLFRCGGPAAGFVFSDASAEMGLTEHYDDRGAAVGDLDGDGDQDILVSPTNGQLRLYENRVPREGQGTLIVRAQTKTSAPGGVGTEVKWIDAKGHPHIRVIGGNGMTASQNDVAAYFALGPEAEVDVSVRFTSGLTLEYANVPANTTLYAIEPNLIRPPFRTHAINTGGTPTVLTLPIGSKSFVVQALAMDATGQALGAEADVKIEIPGLSSRGAVKHVGGALFERSFHLPTKVGSHRLRVSFDDFVVGIEPLLHFYSAGDVSETNVRVIPEAIRAGSGDIFRVEVAPKAAGGFRQENASAVSVEIGGLTPFQTNLDVPGLQVFSFTAPDLPGSYPVLVTVDGTPIPVEIQLEASDVPVKSTTGVYFEEPIGTQSAAPDTMNVQLTPRDANSLRIGPYANLVFTALPDEDSVPVVIRDDLPTIGQADGDYLFVVSKPYGTPDGGAVGSFHLTVDGVDLGTFPYFF